MNKYDYNKYPINSFELVCVVQSLVDANTGKYNYLVFPDVLDKYDVATSSEGRVINAMKGAYGKIIIKAVDISAIGVESKDDLTPDSVGGKALAKIQRDSTTLTSSGEKVRLANLNGKYLTAYKTFKLPIPQNIIDSTTEYCNLATKGNSTSKGLDTTDEARFNELDELLANYYSKCI